jgi:hypothetical protein
VVKGKKKKKRDRIQLERVYKGQYWKIRNKINNGSIGLKEISMDPY